MLENKKIIKSSEKNLVSTIDNSNKKTKKIFIIIIIIIVVITISLITLFVIDVNRMQNNKAVLFSTWGFNYIEPINIESKKMEIAIKDYLVNKDDEKNLEFKNAKSFAGVKLILTEENTNDSMCVYAWVLQAKYYIKNNEIKEINSSSIPYKFILKR